MDPSSAPLREYEYGAFDDLRGRPNPDGMVAEPYPPFAQQLAVMEQQAGRPLTAKEAEAARRKAPCLALSRREAERMRAAIAGGLWSRVGWRMSIKLRMMPLWMKINFLVILLLALWSSWTIHKDDWRSQPGTASPDTVQLEGRHAASAARLVPR